MKTKTTEKGTTTVKKKRYKWGGNEKKLKDYFNKKNGISN